MKEKEILTIPFVAHESAMNRMEKANKRLWIIIIVMFIGMLTYLLLPTEITTEETSQNVEDASGSEITQIIGE